MQPGDAQAAADGRWQPRAAQVGARPADAAQGAERLATLWAGGRLAGAFDRESITRLAQYFHFAHVAAGRRVIEQDEIGDFMFVILEGAITVERHPESARLSESRAGDVLGEMALLDAGPRFSRCTTRTPCLLAVLEADALARLMKEDAHLALALVGALARWLSLRVRQVSARLAALLGEAGEARQD